jgi:hypothetical protein
MKLNQELLSQVANCMKSTNHRWAKETPEDKELLAELDAQLSVLLKKITNLKEKEYFNPTAEDLNNEITRMLTVMKNEKLYNLSCGGITITKRNEDYVISLPGGRKLLTT